MEGKNVFSVYSTTLQKAVPAQKSGNVLIISHKLIEKLVSEIEIECHFQVVSADMTHAVVLCALTADGVQINTIGETTPETLWSEADRAYPVTVAWNRAYDRAVIRYLAFDKPVFSSKEIKPEKTGTSAVAQDNEENSRPTPAAEPAPVPVPVQIQKPETTGGYAKTATENVTGGQRRNTPPPERKENKSTALQYREPPMLAPGMMQIGPCKGKPIATARTSTAYAEFAKFAKEAGVEYANPDMQKQLLEVLQDA